MPSNAFTHMDEVTRRRIVAILASQSIEAGTLPPRYVDLAHLLFGDPASSEDVGHLVDLAAIPAFEQAISKVAEALRLLESTLWSTRLGDRPLALDIAKQLKQPQPGSTATAESLSKLASEIDGRMEDHLAYLKERAIYLGLNAYLRERYLALPSQLASKKLQKAWKTNAQAASETVAMIGTELATAAVEGRRPKDVTAILSKKPRTKKDAREEEKPTDPEVAEKGEPEARPPPPDSNEAPPSSPFTPDPPANAAINVSGPASDGTTPRIAQGHSASSTHRQENRRRPTRVPSLIQAPPRSEAEDYKMPFLGPPVEEKWETIVDMIRYRCGFDRGYIDKDKKLTEAQKKITVDPLNILKYHEKRSSSDVIRLNDVLSKFGHPKVLGHYGGIDSTEPCKGFFAELEKMKRRQQKQTYVKLFNSIKSGKNYLGIIDILFGKFLSKDSLMLIYLFNVRRNLVGGTPFRQESDRTDWWENIYSYDAYYQYNLLQCKLALKSLAVLDMYPYCIGKDDIPLGLFFQKDSFYHEIKPRRGRPKSERGPYFNEISMQLKADFEAAGDMPELINASEVTDTTYAEMKSRWISDRQSHLLDSQSLIIDTDYRYDYYHSNGNSA